MMIEFIKKYKTPISIISVLFIGLIFIIIYFNKDNIEPFESLTIDSIQDNITEYGLDNYIKSLDLEQIEKKLNKLYELRPKLYQTKFASTYLSHIANWDWNIDIVIEFDRNDGEPLEKKARQDILKYFKEQIGRFKDEDFLNFYRTHEIISLCNKLIETMDNYFVQTRPEVTDIKNALNIILETFTLIKEMSFVDFDLDNLNEIQKIKVQDKETKNKLKTIFDSIIRNEKDKKYQLTEEQMFYVLGKRNYMEQQFSHLAKQYEDLYNETNFEHYKRISQSFKGLAQQFSKKAKEAENSLKRAGTMISFDTKNIKSKNIPTNTLPHLHGSFNQSNYLLNNPISNTFIDNIKQLDKTHNKLGSVEVTPIINT